MTFHKNLSAKDYNPNIALKFPNLLGIWHHILSPFEG